MQGRHIDRLARNYSPGVSWDYLVQPAKFVVSGKQNRVLSRNGTDSNSWESARVTQPQTSGKWYCELVLGGAAANSYYVFGLCNQNPNVMSGYLGLTCAAVLNVSGKSGGVKGDGSGAFGTNVTTSWSGSLSPAIGDTINLALDVDNGRFYIGKNGVWANGANPASGTGYALSFTPGGEGWSFAASINNGTSALRQLTLMADGFNYAPPSGFSALPAPSRVRNRNRVLYVSEGDSITSGANTSYVGYPAILPTIVPSFNFGVLNNALGGSSLSSLSSRAAKLNELVADVQRPDTRQILSVLCGYNDYTLSAPAAATYCASLATYLDTMRAKRPIALCTLTPAAASGFNAWRATVNATLRTWVGTHCDAIIDFAADPVMGPDAAIGNAALYQDLAVHPSAAGQQLLAAIASPVIRAMAA